MLFEVIVLISQLNDKTMSSYAPKYLELRFDWITMIFQEVEYRIVICNTVQQGLQQLNR